jgi:hypothetical protein
MIPTIGLGVFRSRKAAKGRRESGPEALVMEQRGLT